MTAPSRNTPARAPKGDETARPSGAMRPRLWDSSVTSYYLILGATLLLTALGLVMVLSSSSVTSMVSVGSPYATFINQARWALIGLPLLWAASRLPNLTYMRLAWPILGIAIFLQLLVFSPLGIDVKGNVNWIEIAGQRFQPSETIKLALIIWLAVVLSRKHHLLSKWSHVLIPAFPIVALSVGIVLYGHDLGTAMVILIAVGGVLFTAGVPLRMFGVAGAIMILAVGRLAFTSDNRMTRIGAWLDPDCDKLGACYQASHGMWGLAEGGIWGMGLGASRQKWQYLPEAHNDFIFAIIGEELGLWGTVLVLLLFVVLAVGMARVIRRHKDPFVKIATGGVLAWIMGQMLINIGGVVGLLPVIGVPLPLVSAGGSALVMTLLAIGLVLSFARTEPGAKEALAARGSVVRKTLAVVGRTRRGRAKD